MRLIILGAGGYGRTVADVAAQTGQFDEISFLDDNSTAPDVIGKCAEFERFRDGQTAFYPAFGNNEGRLTWLYRLREAGCAVPTIIHPTRLRQSHRAGGARRESSFPTPSSTQIAWSRPAASSTAGLSSIMVACLEEGVHICLGAIVKAENRIPRCMKIEAGEVVQEPRLSAVNKEQTNMASFQNNGKLKLLIIVGTRPEIIRLAAVITKCRQYFDTILAHTGQNYDYNLNGVFFHDLELADPEVYMDAVGDTLGQTMGNIIAKSYDLMVELQPDAVLVLGDTNSCLSVIGAKRLHIPIFHMEAGNRCKDECLPEETNRRIVDIISDVNLCYSEHARRYLADCGLPKERTYVTGSPDGGGAARKPRQDRGQRHSRRGWGSAKGQVHPALCPSGGEHRHGEELHQPVHGHQ